MVYIDRHARPLVEQALADTRVVLIEGPRQAGKSTLAREVMRRSEGGIELTLDNELTRRAARDDPAGFVAGLSGLTMIDEIQRAPELILAIKEVVDRDPRPGQFLLTGSTSLHGLRRVRDLLPGRMETVRLWPLAQSEIAGRSGNVVEQMLAAGEPPRITGAPVGRDAFVSALAAGGFPDARTRASTRRVRWFRDYLAAIIAADIPDVAVLQRTAEIPPLLRLLAAQTGGIADYRKIARSLSIADKTTKSYVAVLEQLFLVQTLRAWRPGIGKREIHAPKLHLVDSGLLTFLLEADERRVATDDQITGPALESFCAMEIVKHASLCPDPPSVFHYRDGREEIDMVLETRGGSIAAVEVKASATIRPGDHRAIGNLRDARSDRFRCGIVLYTGATTVPLGDRIWAVPISGLWGGAEMPAA
ncbi:MAG: ATP-binding protein [Patulibacter sp.]